MTLAVRTAARRGQQARDRARRGDDESPLRPSLNAVLPIQFHAAHPGARVAEPERALVAALLADAVDGYVRRADAVRPGQRRIFEECEQWLFDDDASSPFSFHGACAILGLDPDCLRRQLRDRRCSERHPPRGRRRQTTSASST